MPEGEEQNKMKKIAILMTCFNRREKTKKCLQTLFKNNSENFQVYLVDDGCTDGTPDMVKKEFPEVVILKGNGSLYWNQGMRFAFQEAHKKMHPFYLWVNDDVEFTDSLLENLMRNYECARNQSSKKDSIIVGYTMDKERKSITYGGYRVKKTFIPISLEKVIPNKKIQNCDTFNGNCVLIPKQVVDEIGYNCEVYKHSSGDIDYGLTATAANFDIYLTDFCVGICEANLGARIWNDIHFKAPIKEKYRAMTSIRFRPNNEWIYFTKKFGGWRWPVRFVMPYIKLAVSSLLNKFS